MIDLLTMLALATSAQDHTPNEPPASLSAEVEAVMQSRGIPAVGAAIVQNGELVWSETWGADDQALFNVASLAKPVAAETILRLASRDLLDLDASMAEAYVDPDITDDPRTSQLTLRLALSHQSGFPNWRAQSDGVLTFQFEPGTRHGYSGEGYEYAAQAAQAWIGTPFNVLMENEVLAPAGALDQIVIGQAPDVDNRRLKPHRADGSQAPLSIPEGWSAADDLWTTPTGYGRVLASIMRGDRLTAEDAAQRNTITFDQAPMACNPEGPLAEICPDALGFGLGRVVFEYEDGPVIWHGGGDEGERAVMFYSPDTQTGMVIMTNSANGGHVFPVLAALADPGEDFIAFLNFQANQN